MVKFIFFSFVFHLTLLAAFKLDIVDLKKNKEQAVNVSLSLEKKTIKEKIKKDIKPKKTTKEKITKDIKPKKTTKEKIKKDIKPKKTIKENTKKKIKPKKTIKENPKSTNEKKFDNLLKDLAQEKLPLETQDNFERKLQKLSKQKLKNSNLDNITINQNELSFIEKIILNQIDENWSRPPGIKISKNLVIKTIVRLDINGNVIGLQVHKSTQSDINDDKSLQPYLDSAIRAIKKASPFEGLKKDMYNDWKELIINFKPIESR